MLTGTIRPVETRTVTVKGEGIAEIHAALAAAAPDGFELTDAPVAPIKGETAFTSTGTFKRRAASTEIEAEDMAALRAMVPDGYELLTVR